MYMERENSELPSASSSRKVTLADSIDILGLSARTRNALKRGDVHTIADLMERVAMGALHSIRSCGPACEQEVLRRLKEVGINPNDPTQFQSEEFEDVRQCEPPSRREAAASDISNLGKHILEFMIRFVQARIDAGLLHPQAQYQGKSITQIFKSSLMKDLQIEDLISLFERLFIITPTVTAEVARLFGEKDRRKLRIAIERHSLLRPTLEELGKKYGVTRERIRQICNAIERKLKGLTLPNSTSIHIQTALLVAKDMGDALSFSHWEFYLRNSGLLGLEYPGGSNIDPFDALVALVNMLAESRGSQNLIPENLKIAIEMAEKGKPHIPVGAAKLLRSLSKDDRRFIRRHANHSGGVYSAWLARKIGIGQGSLRQVLEALGYRHVSQDWYLPSHPGRIITKDTAKNAVFHNSLKKMFQYCGQLTTEELSAGLRLAVSRTEFPVPPPNVLEKFLEAYGYSSDGNGRFYWDGELSESLSRGEALIWKCIEEHGPVVSHDKLARAFVESELSFPSLHATLRRSPIFERIDYGLYKIRGTPVTWGDIERARETIESVSLDFNHRFRPDGCIEISLNLNISALGTGTIQVYRADFPDLSGEWDCFAKENYFGKITVTEQEIRDLKKPLEFLQCKEGDRLLFIFNTWKRCVTIEIGNENED